MNLWRAKANGEQTWAFTNCEMLYVAQNQAEYEALRSEDGGKYANNVLYLDRSIVASAIGDTSAKGIMDFFDQRGHRTPAQGDPADPNCKWYLTQSALPCSCNHCDCSHNAAPGACPYTYIRKGGRNGPGIRTILVQDVSLDEEYAYRRKVESFVKQTYFQKVSYINQEMLKTKIREVIGGDEAEALINNAMHPKLVYFLHMLYSYHHPQQDD